MSIGDLLHDEARPAPRRRTWGYWFAMCTMVFPIWVITPLSWMYLIWTLATAHPLGLQYVRSPAHILPSSVNYILLFWATAEVLFSLYYAHLTRMVQMRAPSVQYSKAFLMDVFEHCFSVGLDPADRDLIFDHKYHHARASSQDNSNTTLNDYNLRKRGSGRPHEDADAVPHVQGSAGRMLDCNSPSAQEFRRQLRMWFCNAPLSQIKRDNLLEWLAWSLWSQHLEEIPQGGEDMAFLEQLKDLVERRMGYRLAEGRTEQLKSLRLTLDPVGVSVRPLVLYIFVYLLNLVTRWRLYFAGYKEVRAGACSYLVRCADNWTPQHPDELPIIFLHGLGIGISQYTDFLSQAHAELPPDVPIIIMVQPHISTNIFSRAHLHPPNEAKTTASLYELFVRYGFDKTGLLFLSHSNGTIVHGWMMRRYPHLVKRSCMVDPVCFRLWEADVCYNFLYRPPCTSIELLMSYFVAREVGVAKYLARAFDWAVNVAFHHEIPHANDPAKTRVFMAGQDAVMNARRVHAYLLEMGMREESIVLEEHYSHGQCLVRGGTSTTDILRWIRDGMKPDAAKHKYS